MDSISVEQSSALLQTAEFAEAFLKNMEQYGTRLPAPSKVGQSWRQLILTAFHQSSNPKLTVNDIYQLIADHSYFKTNSSKNYKSTIRDCLRVHPNDFKLSAKVGKRKTWTLNTS